MKFNSAHVEFLRALYEQPGKGVELYTLHERFKLSPGQLSRMCSELEKLGVIYTTKDEAGGITAAITEHGREWVIGHRRDLFLRDRGRCWSVPTVSAKAPADPFEPYLPRLRKVQKPFFER